MQYELNVKNFLLTGDSTFLDTAGDSATLLPAKIEQLKSLTADEPSQLSHIDSLASYVEQNSKVLQQAILVSKTNNFAGAAELILAEATTGLLTPHSVDHLSAECK